MPMSEKEYLKTPMKSKQDDLRKEIEFLKNKAYNLRMKFLGENPEFVAETDLQHSLTLPGAMEYNLTAEMLRRKQQEFDELQDKLVEPIMEPFDEEKEYQVLANKELISTLIKMADELDHEDKTELAEEVDKVLSSFAARPKAPFKSIDDAIKTNLINFLISGRNSLDHVINDEKDGLEELMRRLRYYGIDGIVKEIGLDRVLNSLKELHSEISVAVNKFYELTHGRRPGKNELSGITEQTQEAKDFFASQVQSEGLFQRDPFGRRMPSTAKPVKCDDCGEDMPLKIMQSPAGFYLGRGCSCGPFSRDSGYYKTEDEAKKVFDKITGEFKAAEEGKESEPETPETTEEPKDEDISEEEMKDFWQDYNKIM